jgi:hypothetical protein
MAMPTGAVGLNTTGFQGSLPWGRTLQKPGAPTVAASGHLSEYHSMGTFHPMVGGCHLSPRLVALVATTQFSRSCVPTDCCWAYGQGMDDARRTNDMEGLKMAQSTMRRSGGLT